LGHFQIKCYPGPEIWLEPLGIPLKLVAIAVELDEHTRKLVVIDSH
jgi:hypothetical protein